MTYADSAKTETGSKTSYTAKLSSSGHLLLADGTETLYLPVYQDGTKDLIGAMRDTSYAANTATAAWLPGAAFSLAVERYFQRCSRVGQTNTGRCAAPPGCSRGRALVWVARFTERNGRSQL